jgi:hypothetical protein
MVQSFLTFEGRRIGLLVVEVSFALEQVVDGQQVVDGKGIA